VSISQATSRMGVPTIRAVAAFDGGQLILLVGGHESPG
jgi:hypothetical protein